MIKEINTTIDAFTNEDIKKLTKAIFEDKTSILSYFPAAKSNHHALKGGLLYHTYSMLQIGKSLTPLYPFLNAAFTVFRYYSARYRQDYRDGIR